MIGYMPLNLLIVILVAFVAVSVKPFTTQPIPVIHLIAVFLSLHAQSVAPTLSALV